MIIDINYEEFLRNFYSNDGLYKNFNDFILRLRKPSEKNENIAYYNGLKAFSVKKTSHNEVLLDFPRNVYKINKSDIKHAKDLEIEASMERKLEAYYKRIKEICSNMETIFDFKMQTIKFKLNNTTKEDLTNEILWFQTKINKYAHKYHFNPNFSQDYFPNGKAVFKFPEAITNPNAIIMVQYYFVLYFGYANCRLTKNKDDVTTISYGNKSLIKEIDFADYSVKYNPAKVSSLTRKIAKNGTDTTPLNIFIKGIKKAIDDYSASEKVEKKYQHEFMLHAQDSNIFSKSPDEHVAHFEQEYGIINIRSKNGVTKEKRGRIDCIFYKYKESNSKINITDIFLIEIKVDSKVVLKDNGVITHLDDIKAFLKFKNNRYSSYELPTLKDRIIYRLAFLKNIPESSITISNCKMHFYTVFGFHEDSERIKTTEQIKGLCDIKTLKAWCNKEYRKQNKIATSESVDPYFEDTNLYKVAPSKKDCEIRFFYEKENYTKEISNEFKDVTKEVAPEFLK